MPRARRPKKSASLGTGLATGSEEIGAGDEPYPAHRLWSLRATKASTRALRFASPDTMAFPHRAARTPSPLSIVEHGPNRADGDKHPVRPILKAPETEAAVEFHATRESFVPAVVDHIEHDQLEPHLAGDI